MNLNNKKILLLGGSGMLGHVLLRYLKENSIYEVFSTFRKEKSEIFRKDFISSRYFYGYDANNFEKFKILLRNLKPEIVINCIGIIKQVKSAKDLKTILPINSIFPHEIARLSAELNIKFIHISTDCVFNGEKGMYKEKDEPNANDIYGISKKLGETFKYFSNTIDIRTSIIGPELDTKNSLLNWFLSQNGSVKGYQKAIFSGFPTNELARILNEYVIDNNKLKGLYHISSNPINKYQLLKLFAKYYKKKIDIIVDDTYKIDRSLDSTKFKKISGYQPPSWEILVKKMSEFQ